MTTRTKPEVTRFERDRDRFLSMLSAVESDVLDEVEADDADTAEPDELDASAFRTSGLLDAEGRPVSAGQPIPSGIRVAVVDVSRVLRAQLRSNPDQIFELEPRRFEELVASLLAEQGFTVELTPTSRDGGYDIAAARRTDLGSFPLLCGM